MRIYNKTFLSAGDMSGNLTSGGQELLSYEMYSIQAVFTGSPNGTLKLQASNDDTTYTDLTGATITITTNGDGIFNVSGVGYPYVRAVYTRSSGTGSLTLNINAKGTQR